jgi:isoleucyl-tRNA synthetase
MHSRSQKVLCNAQTVLSHLIEHMASMLAPLLPHLAEEVYTHIPYPKAHESVFQNGELPAVVRHTITHKQTGWLARNFGSTDEQMWELVRLLRNDVNKCIDGGRKEKVHACMGVLVYADCTL